MRPLLPRPKNQRRLDPGVANEGERGKEDRDADADFPARLGHALERRDRDFEMPKQDAGGATDVYHPQLPPLPRRFGSPTVDVVRERVVARPARTVTLAPARIDAVGVMKLGDEARGHLNHRAPRPCAGGS
jgi:hypothetical protein